MKMPRTRGFWTSPHEDGSWTVKKIGSSRAASVHNTQADAWREARRLARGQGSDAYLRGRDGKIRANNSYGNDPIPL